MARNSYPSRKVFTKKAIEKLDPGVTLKDNELRKIVMSCPDIINLSLGTRMDMVRQLERDTKFLESQGLMDYSLLLVVEETVQNRDSATKNS